MGVPKKRVPQNGWFILEKLENLIKMDDLGGAPIFGNTHMKKYIFFLVGVHR